MKATPLKLLIVGLNYLPEPTGIAPYTSKMAARLKGLGMTVRSLTGYPHYPGWKILDGYGGMRLKDSVLGVDVLRLRHPVPSGDNFVARALMESLFGFHAVSVRWSKPDVVIAVTPALFSVALVQLKAKLTGVPCGVWVQDIYTRGMEETRGPGSPMTRVMRAVEGRVLRKAEGVAVIHERFKSYAVSVLGVPAERVHVIRNWTHIATPEEFDREATRSQVGWAPEDFVVLHAGNMGIKQGLSHVVESARNCKNSAVKFVLMGDGNQRKSLEALAEGVPNLQFISSVSDEMYPRILRSADALLVNELPGLREMSVPSKLTSYFSTGIPVIASTDSASSTADEIRASGAGILVDPADVEAITAAAAKLSEDPELARGLGSKGPVYVQDMLSEDAAVKEFTRWVSGLVRH